MRFFSIIVAVDKKNGIGKDGKIPWALPSDMKHFKAMTTETSSSGKTNAVIMGRKTWESLPEKWRPLPHRLNVVLTQDKNYSVPSNVVKSQGLDEALRVLDSKEYQKTVDKIFVIGGANVYAQALVHPRCQRVYLTVIDKEFGCDAFFPEWKQNFKKAECSDLLVENDIKYFFAVYERL